MLIKLLAALAGGAVRILVGVGPTVLFLLAVKVPFAFTVGRGRVLKVDSGVCDEEEDFIVGVTELLAALLLAVVAVDLMVTVDLVVGAASDLMVNCGV